MFKRCFIYTIILFIIVIAEVFEVMNECYPETDTFEKHFN